MSALVEGPDDALTRAITAVLSETNGDVLVLCDPAIDRAERIAAFAAGCASRGAALCVRMADDPDPDERAADAVAIRALARRHAPRLRVNGVWASTRTRPETVAQVVRFLADAEAITAQVVAVDDEVGR